MTQNADSGRVIDWPKTLRGTADWLDTVDDWLEWALPILSWIQGQPDGLAEALECVRGQEMQDDLRRLAEILEVSPIASTGADP